MGELMSDPIFLGISATAWIALGTVAMALAAVASVFVSVLLMKSQDRVIDMQAHLIELQRQANWLNGALESHSAISLRLRAEEMGKKVVWWDPTHNGFKKEAPPTNEAHLANAVCDKIYPYVSPDRRAHPDLM